VLVKTYFDHDKIIFLTVRIFVCYRAVMNLNTKKLKEEMKRQGINQSDLARAFGVTRQSISLYMRKGIGSFRILEKIADYFNLDPKDLII
jgi:DNA-binding XRE family transcriptional regulator